MKGNELVWRTLADAALSGQRSWPNLSDLAFESGVPLTTTHLATRKLVEIGAIQQYPGGGLSTLNPEKILTLLCAWRNLSRDTIAKTTRAGFEKLTLSRQVTFALGGPEAAVNLLGGKNTVSDFSQTIAYIPKRLGNNLKFPPGEEVTILDMDRRAETSWRGYSSVAQTYADLFATPGWQASEFFLALRDRFLAGRDWEEK